jgi:hypothetical protein
VGTGSNRVAFAAFVGLAALTGAAAGIDPARAQPGTPPAPAPPPTPDDAASRPAPPPDPAPAPPPSVDARDDEAWQLYHQAFAALARDDRAAARRAAAELRGRFPAHPATAQATQAIDAPVAPRPRGGRERPDQASRAELALFQTFHGAAVGVELCVVAECDSGEAYIGLALLGGAGGAALSLRARPTPGQRALVNSGTAWGAFNAAMVLVATQPDDAPAFGLTLLAGQGAGVGLALLLSGDAPSAGQVALANSGGQWTLALTGLGLVAADVDLDERQVATTLALAADAGIGLGAYLAWQRPQVSRAQTLVIDAAGIVGAVAGGAGGVMITGDVEDRSTAGLAAAGAALGLGAAAYLTRHWGDDDDGPPVHTTITPVRGGGLVSAHLTW